MSPLLKEERAPIIEKKDGKEVMEPIIFPIRYGG